MLRLSSQSCGIYRQLIITTMIITTTPTIEGHQIKEYKGLVSGEVVFGMNFVKDFFAGLHDFFGGRSGGMRNL